MEWFVFTGIIWKESDEYSALCPELDIASQGETIAEARKNLLEAAVLHLEGFIEDGLHTRALSLYPMIHAIPVVVSLWKSSNSR